jgi:hypothetical protein
MKSKKIYPYVYENPIIIEKGKDIDCCVISKFIPKKITMQNLTGILSYPNTLQIIEFENLVIFNCYLQAGSKASPGQITKWMHYSRCRSQYFEYIKKLIEEYESNNKGIILLGDLNFNLNGTINDWPELKSFNKMGLDDSWITTNPGQPGLTEDTTKNFMRWNSKFEEKEYRYDAILYNKKLRPTSSTIFGDVSKKLIKESNDIYEKVIIPENNRSDPRLIKSSTYINNQGEMKNEYELFISDHFGVLSSFELFTSNFAK